jgi:hypothetical protein
MDISPSDFSRYPHQLGKVITERELLDEHMREAMEIHLMLLKNFLPHSLKKAKVAYNRIVFSWLTHSSNEVMLPH